MKINSLIKLIGSIIIIVLLALCIISCDAKPINKSEHNIGYYTDTIDNIVIISVVVSDEYSHSVSVSSLKLKEL